MTRTSNIREAHRAEDRRCAGATWAGARSGGGADGNSDLLHLHTERAPEEMGRGGKRPKGEHLRLARGRRGRRNGRPARRCRRRLAFLTDAANARGQSLGVVAAAW